jgi:DNA-binding MarR family transcriptional regulator
MNAMHNPPYSTTLTVRDTCMCLHVQRAARALARRFDEALKPSGLTNQQFSLLMSLNRPQPPRMKEVALLLALDRTTLTANLKPLEQRGLLRIEPDEEDGRSRRLALTDAGRAALVAALPAWCETEAAVEAQMKGDAEQLRAQLRSLG